MDTRQRSRFWLILAVISTGVISLGFQKHVVLKAQEQDKVLKAQEQDKEKKKTPHLVGDEDVASLGRVKKVIDDWDPRKTKNPYVFSVPKKVRDGEKTVTKMEKTARRADLNEFIVDFAAAEALGKAFFWDMQAGSDFRRENGKFIGTACASCHYRFGVDARDTQTLRIPTVVWDQHKLHPKHPLSHNQEQEKFDARRNATTQIKTRNELYQQRKKQPFNKQGEFEAGDDGVTNEDSPTTSFSTIVGSQGVQPRVFQGLNPKPFDPTSAADWKSEISTERVSKRVGDGKPEWQMFQKERMSFEQITGINAPSMINSCFSNRLFYNGRAESTFNGFSQFGDADKREVIHVRRHDGKIVPIQIALTNAALASQAVVPIVNSVEMSYLNRTFPDLAKKMIDAPVLGYQEVADEDSHLGKYKKEGLVGPGSAYRKLIQQAFRPEWWDGSITDEKAQASDEGPSEDAMKVDLILNDDESKGTLMEANFSLYWGLSILVYEASLVSNQSPFDDMMSGNPDSVNARWEQVKARFAEIAIDRFRTTNAEAIKPPPTPFSSLKSGAEVFQRGFRLFQNKGCIDCHSGPLFSELYSRDANSETGIPIQYAIDRALLPNSKADAIAIELQGLKVKVRDEVLKIINPNETSEVKREKIAAELNFYQILEEANGSQIAIARILEKRLALNSIKLSDEKKKKIAQKLIEYEKTAANHVGDRTFFLEKERLGFVKSMVDSLLIERLIFAPPSPGNPGSAARRPIRSNGPASLLISAFYDGGFYNIGVAPPRYDAGIGHAEHPEWDEESHRASSGPANIFPSAAVLNKRNQRKSVKIPEKKAKADAATPTVQIADKTDQDKTDQDLSWLRNLPIWSESFKGEVEERYDTRRTAMYFFSRVRRLVFDESPVGFRKPFLTDDELAFWGAFKTPPLRNVELTGPYMHNGRLLTLWDVVEFYDHGGDVPADAEFNPDKAPAIRELHLTGDDQASLVFFLMCLTDHRVQNEMAPFDHPSIRISNGYDEEIIDGTPQLKRKLIELESVGASGVGADVKREQFPSSK